MRKICESLLLTRDGASRFERQNDKSGLNKPKALTVADLERIVNALPKTLAEVNERNREFWKGRVA